MGNTKTTDGQAPLDFEAMLRALKAQPRAPQTVDVDISAHMGLQAGAAIVTLKELDTARMFTIPSDAGLIKKRQPDWPMELCATVAMLALAHTAPAPKGPAADFYIQIALAKRALFTHLLTRYRAAFPAISEIGEVTDEQKND